jgi:phospholipid/cholesterol/gamma-HCH transport system permease protein
VEASAQKRDGAVDRLLAEAGDLTSFSGRALVASLGVLRYTSEVLRQAAILIKGSTLIIAAMSACIGIALITFAVYFLQAAGATDYTGAVSGIGVPRAATPLMFGYVFAAKVGAGLTAEIGAMRIAEEIDALEAEGVEPMRYVVGVRVAATLLFLPLAVGVALIGATVGAYVNAIWILDALQPGVFLSDHWDFQNLADQLYAFGTSAVLGIGIVLVACFFGYRAEGGPAGVGNAVARSLVVNLVLVHIVVSVALVAVYGTNLGLPVGG